MKSRSYSHAPGIILFVVFLIIGSLTYKDYGMAWDEPAQKEIGTVSYNYLFNHDKVFETFYNKDYGVGYELPLVAIEKNLHLTDTRDIYLMRHIVNYVFFLLGALCLYVLILRLTKKQLLACLGFLMLVLTPRMYAHAFFNTKDIPLLTMFIISFLITQLAFEKNRPGWFILLGMAWGYTTSIRISGILPMGFVGCFMLIDLFTNIKNKEKLKWAVINPLVFVVFYVLTTIACWPRLWPAPLPIFLEVYHTFSNYNLWGGVILFKGTIYPAGHLPWYYVPYYMSVTIPEIWFLAGIAGAGWVVYCILRKPQAFLANTLQRNYVFYLCCLLAPVAAVIFLGSVLYDDWRHLYFVYPSFILMVIFLVDKLLQARVRTALVAVCGLQAVVLVFFMIKNHPFQQVYFNNFVSHDKESLRKNYEMDYWGLSYKQGLEYILAHDNADTIKLMRDHSLEAIMVNNISMLPLAQRNRCIIVDEPQAKYFMTNFRYHPDDYSYPVIYHDFKVENSTMLRIYKLQ